ncbi:hypothetical protein SDRG_06898 [Saprolegnia diclina VS20]|uniref:Myb-like domain-containing protein n=1 Tax=Saprolegnia diclina (strain VS20) TaxID=1156394 RepID=T0QCK0_SAPDV|nr:hypothetical protein SDRG_06898 [Saprolegnia diclina VS20]EQC35614.1 hypothetical protein SDRG_06898 [Saprolegnia diclina VS20]|eukprot:XP_008610931.1 hypothetical protein SDRG_06898 [Saprolegnia diclina VS20]
MAETVKREAAPRQKLRRRSSSKLVPRRLSFPAPTPSQKKARRRDSQAFEFEANTKAEPGPKVEPTPLAIPMSPNVFGPISPPRVDAFRLDVRDEHASQSTMLQSIAEVPQDEMSFSQASPRPRRRTVKTPKDHKACLPPNSGNDDDDDDTAQLLAENPPPVWSGAESSSDEHDEYDDDAPLSQSFKNEDDMRRLSQRLRSQLASDGDETDEADPAPKLTTSEIRSMKTRLTREANRYFGYREYSGRMELPSQYAVYASASPSAPAPPPRSSYVRVGDTTNRSPPFSPDELNYLIEMALEYGPQWAYILQEGRACGRLLPCRTTNKLRHKFTRLGRKGVRMSAAAKRRAKETPEIPRKHKPYSPAELEYLHMAYQELGHSFAAILDIGQAMGLLEGRSRPDITVKIHSTIKKFARWDTALLGKHAHRSARADVPVRFGTLPPMLCNVRLQMKVYKLKRFIHAEYNLDLPLSYLHVTLDDDESLVLDDTMTIDECVGPNDIENVCFRVAITPGAV